MNGNIVKEDKFICPVCSSVMKLVRRGYSFGKIRIGTYEAVECPTCGKHFFTGKGLSEIMEDYSLLKDNKMISDSRMIVMSSIHYGTPENNTRTTFPMDREDYHLKPLAFDRNSLVITRTEEVTYSEEQVVPSVDKL